MPGQISLVLRLVFHSKRLKFYQIIKTGRISVLFAEPLWKDFDTEI